MRVSTQHPFCRAVYELETCNHFALAGVAAKPLWRTLRNCHLQHVRGCFQQSNALETCNHPFPTLVCQGTPAHGAELSPLFLGGGLPTHKALS